MPFDYRRLKGTRRERPPELLNQVRVAGFVKHVYELGAAVGADLDKRRHTLISRPLIGDVTKTDQRAVIQHPRQLIVIPIALTIAGARQVGITDLVFSLRAADDRENGCALGP